MSDKLDYSDELIAERRTGDPGQLPDDMPIWMRNIITWIDTFGDWSGGLFCWMLLPLMFAMVYEVVARKLFIAPTDWAYDVSRMLSGGMFMIGAGYALLKGVHIRADFLYRDMVAADSGNSRRISLYYILFSRDVVLFRQFICVCIKSLDAMGNYRWILRGWLQ